METCAKRLSSLQILRVAARNAAAYEWIHHEGVGRKEGLTTEQLVWLRDLTRRAPSVSAPAPFNNLQAAAFAFADASTRHTKVPNSVYDALRTELAKQPPSGISVEQQLTEAAVTTATYNMVSRFLVASDVDEHANVMTPFPAAGCQTRTIFIENGVTLNTFIAKHADAEKKPWIVFVNSLLTDYTMWEGVMPRLSAKYNILAYDQRGHGKVSRDSPSRLPRSERYPAVISTAGALHNRSAVRRHREAAEPAWHSNTCPSCHWYFAGRSDHPFLRYSAHRQVREDHRVRYAN